MRYFPGKVIRVRRVPGTGDECNTFDILLDSGSKRTGQRRDQIFLEWEDVPSAKTHEEELEQQAILDGTAVAEEKPGDEMPGLAEVTNAKRYANKMVSMFKGAENDDITERGVSRGSMRGSTRGSMRGSTRGSSRGSDGLTNALNAKLKSKREDLLSRGSVPSRASSRRRTPGFT